ncbi:MAG: transglutaminase domain-containing protein [Leptospiraceae bacterium]|nr:transglutaminase domain-containing protein [Leptospiraceae bacterium]
MSFLRQCWSADHKRISSRWPGQAIAFVVVVILLFANTCIVWPPDTAENDSALLILLGSGLSARTESQLDFRDPERLFYSAALPEGYAMDIAFHQHQLIVALQGKNRQKDQLIFLRTNGSILKSTDLPAASLAAIDSWQDNLYILNRVQSRLIQQINPAGQVLQTWQSPSRIAGKLYGLAVQQNAFYTSSYQDGISTVWRMDRVSGPLKPRAIYQVPAKIHALQLRENTLVLAGQTDQENQLHLLDLNGRKQSVLRMPPYTNMGLALRENRLWAMNQYHGAVRLFPFSVDAAQGVVTGGPLVRDVQIRVRFVNHNTNPYQLDYWVPRPVTGELQEINNVSISPPPASLLTDAEQNEWAHIQLPASRSVNEVQISFQIRSLSRVWTLDPSIKLADGSIPSAIRTWHTRVTSAFDYDAPIVKKIIGGLPNQGSYTDQLLSIQDKVNDLLTVNGPSGPEKQASLFLEKGEGRCYAHTLGVAAVARGARIPMRAIGGLNISQSAEAVEDSSVHTWNQFWYPGQGWVDMDSVADDAKNGQHSSDHFAYHPAHYWITFRGAYDRIDYQSSLANRGWYGIYRWQSIDPKNKARVKKEGTRIRSVEPSNVASW